MDVATQISTTDHVGTFVATGTTTVSGDPVLCLGDVYTCTQVGHNSSPNFVVEASTITKDLTGSFISFVGCKTTCGATIITGNPKLQLTG